MKRQPALGTSSYRSPSDLTAALRTGDVDVAVMTQATEFDDRFRREPL